MKKKVVIISSICLIVIIILAVMIFKEDIRYYKEDYKILDDFSDTTNENIYRFYFISVTTLDSNYINYAAKHTLEKKVLNDINSGIMIAHFYRLEDTLELPPQLFEQMRLKYPNKKDVDKNLRYIIRGAVKTYFIDSTGWDASLFYNKLIIPKIGVNAKDVLK